MLPSLENLWFFSQPLSKSGVDMLDKLVREYTYKRCTRILPLRLFLNFLDIACYNAFVVWTIQNSEWNKELDIKNRRKKFIEKNGIATLRFSFLRKYNEMLTSPLRRDIVFLNETWIFSKGSETKSRQDDNIRSVRKPKGYDGKRYIILHLGTENGLIENVNLIFA